MQQVFLILSIFAFVHLRGKILFVTTEYDIVLCVSRVWY